MEQIILNGVDIENIIAEKYNLNPQNGDNVVLDVESKTILKDTIAAKRVYYPVAYIWKENDKALDRPMEDDAKQASIPYTYKCPQHDWKCGYPDITRGKEE